MFADGDRWWLWPMVANGHGGRWWLVVTVHGGVVASGSALVVSDVDDWSQGFMFDGGGGGKRWRW